MSRHNERVCVNYVPLWVNKVSHSRQKRPLSHASHCVETDFFVQKLGVSLTISIFMMPKIQFHRKIQSTFWHENSKTDNFKSTKITWSSDIFGTNIEMRQNRNFQQNQFSEPKIQFCHNVALPPLSLSTNNSPCYVPIHSALRKMAQ